MTELGASRGTLPRGGSTSASTSTSRWRLALFARMWAVAALFHLAGNARDALTTSRPLALASVLLAAAAAATLLQPRRTWTLALLCALVPITAWYEAPVVGNHWVLASALSAVLLVSMRISRVRPADDGDRTWAAFAPTARVCLLVAYSFAAFAKLNHDFFDPAVSCAVVYHNQLVGSWGAAFLQVPVGAPAGRALALAAALTEMSVALMLALPRLRRAGLVLAVGFHWLLAMDLGQHFWDFSAVLFAAFVLLLDDDQVARLRAWSGAPRWRGAVRPSLVRSCVLASAAVVSALAVLPLPRAFDALLVLLGHLAWWGYGTGVALTVVLLLTAPRARTTSGPVLRLPARVLWLAPALVLLNGLTPYLELKTGFGWNMYSNLRTVAGESNHLLVPATLDLTGAQRDQVRVVRSSDPVLDELRDAGYVLAHSEFREYARAHPDADVTYERGGRVVHAPRIGDDPAMAGAASALSSRVQSFRAIDTSGAERCQPTFSPAR